MQQDVELDAMCVGPAEPGVRRNLLTENSLAGKVSRRWSFCRRYLRARRLHDAMRRLEATVAKHFEHEWLAGVSVKVRALPGMEEREWRVPWRSGQYLMRLRWMPWREEGCWASWGAPICVGVYKKGKDGGKREIVRFMSLFIEDGVVHIAQLQGIPLIEMPKGLRDWAERLVKAAVEFAKQEGYAGVKVIRAESLYSYHHPTFRRGIAPEAQEREMKRVRANIEAHHNQTAEGLKFTPRGDWYEWHNPDCLSR